MSQPTAGETRPSLLPQIVHAYMLVIHIALPGLLYFLYGKGAFEPLTPAWSAVPQDPILWSLVGFAIAALALAHVVPRLLLKSRNDSGRSAFALPGAGKDHPLSQVITPYILRLVFLEMCTIAGFVFGMLRETPELCLPFAALGLAGTLLSPPTPAFFRRFVAS